MMHKIALNSKALKSAVTGALALGLLTLSPLSFASDSSFVKEAAQGNLMEIQLGKMVENKATDQSVKDLGKRLMEDHTKANDELKPIAKKLKVTWPTTMDAQGKHMHAELEKLKGKELDKAYAEDMVKDHKKDIAKYDKAKAHVKDKELREYVNKTLPVLHEHLKLAEKVRSEVSGKATGSSGAASTSMGSGGSSGSAGMSTPPETGKKKAYDKME